ncbi:MAG: hypothetical protein K2Y37_08730 [Pirellulales bacterium]|nr:hypothetical protein [Pirellulales bacterium]
MITKTITTILRGQRRGARGAVPGGGDCAAVAVPVGRAESAMWRLPPVHAIWRSERAVRTATAVTTVGHAVRGERAALSTGGRRLSSETQVALGEHRGNGVRYGQPYIGHVDRLT